MAPESSPAARLQKWAELAFEKMQVRMGRAQWRGDLRWFWAFSTSSFLSDPRHASWHPRYVARCAGKDNGGKACQITSSCRTPSYMASTDTTKLPSFVLATRFIVFIKKDIFHLPNLLLSVLVSLLHFTLISFPSALNKTFATFMESYWTEGHLYGIISRFVYLK